MAPNPEEEEQQQEPEGRPEHKFVYRLLKKPEIGRDLVGQKVRAALCCGAEPRKSALLGHFMAWGHACAGTQQPTSKLDCLPPCTCVALCYLLSCLMCARGWLCLEQRRLSQASLLAFSV